MKKEILNESVLLTWRQIDGENWFLMVTEITDLFFEFGPSQLDQLTECWAFQNIEGVKRCAHALKSSCGDIGAERAHEILSQIEGAAENRELEKLKPLMDDLAPIFMESALRLSHFLKKNQAA